MKTWKQAFKDTMPSAGRWRRGAPTRLRGAALATAIATLIDSRQAPHRLSPDFRRRLSAIGPALVRALFALALTLVGHLVGRRSRRPGGAASSRM